MTAAEAAQQMVRTFEGQTRVQRQVLDGNQLQKLSLTLNRPQLHPGLDVTRGPPPAGTPLPPGYHLVYFSPASVESELGADGTDRTFNAPGPFSRRMWAGGRMTWTPGAAPLRVGDEAEERTRFVGAAAKRSRDGSEMVLVDVEKEFWGPEGLALVDRRAWVFRPPPREALARSDAQVAGVVPGAVGRHSTVEDVLVDGSGELGPVFRILALLAADFEHRHTAAQVSVVAGCFVPVLSVDIQRTHDPLQRELDEEC